MSVLASAYPLLEFELDKFLLELQQQDRTAEAGVSVEGDAAAYALVWEWGSARISQPGPKTVWGTNPDGTRVVLSIQAPRGYIRVNEPLYWAAIEQEMQKVSFAGNTAKQIHDSLYKAALQSARRIRTIIREHAPVDTGQLRDSIEVVEEGDTLLDEAGTYNALVLGAEE